MQGRIVKLVPRMFFVQTKDVLYKCKARGKMRLNGAKPLVGDLVEIEKDPIEDDVAQIKKIINRQNSLKRPEIANIDNLIITFAIDMPRPNLELLDWLLVGAEKEGITPVICFNKSDLDKNNLIEKIKDIYSRTTYEIVFISAIDGNEKDNKKIKSLLSKGVNVFSGPSGTGKSTLINLLKPSANMETGEISDKLKRGKHTTRHSELIYLGNEIFLCDTPGFTSYENSMTEVSAIQNYFPEIKKHANNCRFRDCLHINEPDCTVIEALENKKISKERYNSYKTFVNEAKINYKNRY